MKTGFIIFFILLLMQPLSALWQQKIITQNDLGIQVIKEKANVHDKRENSNRHIFSRDERVEMLWETSHATSICGGVCVSEASGNSFVRWQTNAERVSLFADSAFPLWEYTVGNLDFDYPIAMSGNGEILAVGDGTILRLFNQGSSEPFWNLSLNGSITGIQLDHTGSSVYLCYAELTGTSYVQAYDTSSESLLWENPFPGGSGTLTLCADASTLIFTQYGGGYDYMWVMQTEAGEVIFQTDEYNQNPPAMNEDGSIIVNGDYSGYLWVYELDETGNTYNELWHYHVNGGGSSDWIGGMAISADGSTIACGTLTFLTDGYNGQIYLFDISTPEPLWIFENAGDYVVDVDLSADGNIVAACGYGPYDGSEADFFLFRRCSNDPVFTIDTPGSLFSVDLATDGSFCTTGGKAVHAREMGSGGNIYSLDCDLGGGSVSGNVFLEGNADNSGVFAQILGIEDYYAYSDSFGSFSIASVPMGSYTLEFSKTGYEGELYENCLIIEGENTTIPDITLTAYGEPPQNLTASQAEGTEVELNWQPPSTGEPEGYFVYRKRYEGDLYPDEPLAIVWENTYTDNSALPRIEYYYVVTAMTDNNYQSPYSNECQGWISSGFITSNLIAYTGSEPTIDGTIAGGEWDDAFSFDASDFWGTYDSTPQPAGSVIGHLKTSEDGTMLYAAFENYNDPLLEDHDEVALYIDDNGDGSYPAQGNDSEGNYWAVHYAAGNELRFRPIYGSGGVGEVMYLDNPQVAVSDDQGYVVYEFIVPIGEETWKINPGEDNHSTLGIFVLDDNEPDPHGFDSWWPFDNMDIFDPQGYGNIIYGGSAQIPLPPENLTLENMPDNVFKLNWDMPEIADFSHFNIYFAMNDEQFNLLDTSVGTQYLYHYDFYPQTSYSFYLTTVSAAGLVSEDSEIVEFFTSTSGSDHLPYISSLDGNYPNPFNPSTTIRFTIAESEAETELAIYNLKGQKVITLVNEYLQPGSHRVVWHGENEQGKKAASGVYLLQLKNSKFQEMKKILLIK